MNKYVVYSGNNSRMFFVPPLEDRGNWTEASESEAENFYAHFIWKPVLLSVRAYHMMDELHEIGFGPQIHNHLENNRFITTKTGLIRALRQFYHTHEPAVYAGYTVYDSIPTSYIITAFVEDLEYKQFIFRFNDLAMRNFHREKMPEKHCTQNMWLVKPAAMNQGKGIEVCRSLKDVLTFLRTKTMHSLWVVQKYIEKPLLFKGRKFDIRVWALATAKHDFFYYKHGYLRTSSSEYDPHATNNYIHLTNNCLQKYGENYGAHETGNTLSFEEFQAYLTEEYPDLGIDFWAHILPRMKDLMIDTYLSGRRQLSRSKRTLSFELLGFDFLIDEDFRVWLLEVNTNPYLGVPNDYIGKLLPDMIDDLLALTVDVHIPPSIPRKRQTNDFELLYCEVSSIYSASSLNARQPYTVPIYGVPGMVPNLKKTGSCEDEQTGQNDPPKPIVKDCLQSLREVLESSFIVDVNDFSQVTARIIAQLNNWELLSEDNASTALEALNLLANSQGVSALAVFDHCPTLVDLVCSEDIPSYLQTSIIEAVSNAMSNLRFKKEVVRLGICKTLVKYSLEEETKFSIKHASLDALRALSVHSSKRAYIPGETREENWVRSKLINEGGLLALYILNGSFPDEETRNILSRHLSAEFSVADWEFQVSVLERVLGDSPSSAKKKFTIEPDFPECLEDLVKLAQIKDEILSFCQARREEANSKIEKERQRRKEELEEKLRQREEEDRVNEEKRQKVQIYIQRRCDEICAQKMIDEKKRLDERELEEKYNEAKRTQLLEKVNRLEQIRRNQRLKEKQKEIEMKKKEEEMRKAKEEMGKKAMEDWIRKKNEIERERKLLEQTKREEEERLRMQEAEQRRQEIFNRLEEKKQRTRQLKKASEEIKVSTLPIVNCSFKTQSIKELHTNTIKDISSYNTIKEAPQPSIKDYRIKKQKLHKQIITSKLDKALVEVYITGNKNKKSHHRSHSKREHLRKNKLAENLHLKARNSERIDK